MNKKGISAVVTTVLIILLSIIAVIILWAALKGPIGGAASNTGSAISCTEIDLTIDACVIDAAHVNVTVSRTGGTGDVNITASVSDSDSSNLGTAENISPLETTRISVDKTELSGALNVKAAAVLPNGKTCKETEASCGSI